jgi:CheY-like chemotaxis protein
MDAVELLANDGFDVVEAPTANDALAILKQRHLSIHVLFTDVHMPGGMDGLSLAHHARQHWPWIGILIVSGKARLSQSDLPAGSRFLSKPYDSDHVVKHIRELAEVG